MATRAAYSGRAITQKKRRKNRKIWLCEKYFVILHAELCSGRKSAQERCARVRYEPSARHKCKSML